MSTLVDELVSHEEYECISIDTTMRHNHTDRSSVQPREFTGFDVA